MKTKILFLAAIFILSLTPGYSQLNNEKRKKFRAERKLKMEEKVKHLMNSRNFVFEAKTALPTGGAAIDLTTNSNSVKFSPEKISSYMPFYGEAYSIDYGGDSGYKFEAKPETFTTEKLKGDKGYRVIVKVPIPKDKVEMNLNVGIDGSATLTITSYQRKSISYFGSIKEPEKSKEDKSKS
jgi:hypothetical protein